MGKKLLILFLLFIVWVAFFVYVVKADYPIVVKRRTIEVTLEREDSLFITDYGGTGIDGVRVTRNTADGVSTTYKEKLGSNIRKIVIYRYNY